MRVETGGSSVACKATQFGSTPKARSGGVVTMATHLVCTQKIPVQVRSSPPTLGLRADHDLRLRSAMMQFDSA